MMNFPQPEDELYDAIENGDLQQVKRLVSSGIDLNTLLHTKARRESATVLGTAAYEGQIEIMKYLISNRAQINYQDPLLNRNALHWTCSSGSIDAAQLLIDHKIDVNCRDRDNVTPIILAAFWGRISLVGLLIRYGAEVNQYDRLHSSALHYASFYGRSELVGVLVRAGCVLNSRVIFGQGTPLANLVYHGYNESCRLLIEAGYSLDENDWIRKCQASPPLTRDSRILQYLQEQYSNPAPLDRLCLRVIRKCFNGVLVQEKIQSLPLPPRLISYLLLSDI